MTSPALELYPVQERLWDTITDGEHRIIGFGGGIRGTKTWGTLASIVLLCRMFPRSRWCVVRKDLQRVRDTVLPTFAKLSEHAGGFVGPVNQQRWESECTNGSVILFRGESIDKDPDLLRFHGYEVNGFVAEEADELSERTFIKMIERAGTWIVPNGEQPPPYILCTFNPCARWPRRRFYLPWRDNSLKLPYAFIPTTAADNPSISEQQRESWKEMPDAEYRRFVLGDWESISGAYYDTLDPALHLIERCRIPTPLPSHWRYWGSYDWGYAHWAVLGFWCTDTDGVDYLLDSVWLRKLQDDEQAIEYVRHAESGTDDDLSACLKLVYAGTDTGAVIKAHGASGETVKDVFLRHKIILTNADTDKINGGRAVNRQLKVRDGKSGVYIVKTPGNLRGFDQLGEILPDDVDIRKPGKVDAVDGIGGDDFADMFRYGIATRMPAANTPTKILPQGTVGHAMKATDRHKQQLRRQMGIL